MAAAICLRPSRFAQPGREALGVGLGRGLGEHRQRRQLGEVRQALPGVARRDRAALGAVGVEQSIRRPAVEHGRELPGEVVGVLHAGVQPQAAGGREAVRRVAGEEGASAAEGVGDLRAHRPRHDAEDLDRDVARARPERLPDEGERVIAAVLRHVDPARRQLDAEGPQAPRIVGDQRPPPGRAVQPVQHAGARAHELAQVGGERDRDRRRDLLLTGHRDAERLPHVAAGAVRADEVARCELVGPGVGADRRGHAVVPELQPGPAVAAPQVHQRLGGRPAEQDGLEVRLRHVQQGRRRDGEHVVVLALVGHRPEAVARERGDEAHLARELLRRGDGAQRVRGDPQLGVEDLDRPRVHGVRPRQHLRLERLLEDDGRDTPAREEQGERDADDASAGDDHGRPWRVGHGRAANQASDPGSRSSGAPGVPTSRAAAFAATAGVA